MCPTPDDGRDREQPSTPVPEEGASSEDGSALTPDDLDIEDDENVVRLDEDRFVIGTDGRPDAPADADSGASGAGDASEAEQTASEAARSADGPAADGSVADGSAVAGAPASGPERADPSAVKQQLEADLQAASARYGFHLTAKAEDAISHQQMSSDDVGTVFDGLLRWYAQQLTTDTAVEDVLGILLTESNVRVRYSPSCLQAILEAYDLGPDDTIADLVAAVQDDRGMVFPPENV